MSNWNDVLNELAGSQKGPHDHYRLKALQRIHALTNRNILVYYSGWLQKSHVNGIDFGINDADKTGFMTCSHGLDRSKGLDVILHTPGGDVAATESLIEYLHSLYDGNIRVIVPQLAMSGGTLIALSSKEILMGRHSSLGPVDPQIGGMPAQGILEEFNLAADQIKADPNRIPLWQPIIAKYWPTLITSCQHAINWSDALLRQYLTACMFKDLPEAERNAKIDAVANLLGNQSISKSHSRHISQDSAATVGLRITRLEDDQALQDAILTLHHALSITFTQTRAYKILENQAGTAYVLQIQMGVAKP